MEKTIAQLDECTNELTFTLTPEEYQPEIDTMVLEQIKKLNIPGFRKGKYPIELAKKQFGPGLTRKAAEDLVDKKFWEIIQAEEEKPVNTPSIVSLGFIPGEPMKSVVRYEVYPRFTAQGYTGNEVGVHLMEAKEFEVNAQLNRITKSTAEKVELPEVNSKDVDVICKYFKDNNGEPGDMMRERFTVELAENAYAADTAERFMGKKVGDVVKVDYQPYSEDGVEKTNSFFAEILEINAYKMPENLEEYYKSLTGGLASDEASFREFVKNDIQSYYNDRNNESKVQGIEKVIVQNNKFKVPSAFIGMYGDNLYESYKKRVKERNKKAIGKDEYLSQNISEIEDLIRLHLVRDAIAHTEKIEVTDAVIQEFAEKNAPLYQVDPSMLVASYSTKDGKRHIQSRLVDEYLMTNNTFVHQDPQPHIHSHDHDHDHDHDHSHDEQK